MKFLALLYGLFLAISVGAADLAPAPGPSSEMEKLYQVYLNGTVEEARRALLQSIEMLENEKSSDQKASAHARWLNYSRLHVLEARAGNHDLADAALLKARYWFLRKLELAGDSTEKAIILVRGFSGSKCAQVVDQFDREHTDKKGPRYLRPPG
jgi:hypothetical protein